MERPVQHGLGCPGQPVALAQVQLPVPGSGRLVTGPFNTVKKACGSLHVAQTTRLLKALLAVAGGGSVEPVLAGYARLYCRECVLVWDLGDASLAKLVEGLADDRSNYPEGLCRRIMKLEVLAWSLPLAPDSWQRTEGGGRGGLSLTNCINPGGLTSIGQIPGTLMNQQIAFFEGTLA